MKCLLLGLKVCILAAVYLAVPASAMAYPIWSGGGGGGSGGSGTVTTTGSPASGNLANFSGSTSITNGNLSGDLTTSGTLATTLATVNSNAGSFGSSTSIPDFTVNGKGLITAAGGNVVIAPAGTLTGATLASGVTASSLTSAAGGSFGTAAYVSTGTSGATLPLLNANNTWSGNELFNGYITQGGTDTTTSGGVAKNSFYLAPTPAGSNSASFTTVNSSIQYNGSGATSGSVAAFGADAEVFGASAPNITSGIIATCTWDGNSDYSGTPSCYGGLFKIPATGTGAFNHALGLKIDGPTINSTNASSYVGGLYIANQTNQGSGAITEQDAIHIEGKSGTDSVTNAITFGNGTSGINAYFYSPTTNALKFVDSSGATFTGALNVTDSISSTTASTGLSLQAVGHTQVLIGFVGDGTNYIQLGGASAGGTPSFNVNGTDSTIPFVITSKSAPVEFATRGQTGIEMEVLDAGGTPVNYATLTGSTTGNPVLVGAAGSDSNVAVKLAPKGTGAIQMAGGVASTGTKFTTSGCSVSATTGGAAAGTYTSGTTGTCAVTVTMNGATGTVAPTGWSCYAQDVTTPADTQTETTTSTTTAVISGTTVSGDVVRFNCTGY